MTLKYNLYGTESGYIESFNTLEELKKYYKELKEFDKRNGIEEDHYIEIEEEK